MVFRKGGKLKKNECQQKEGKKLEAVSEMIYLEVKLGKHLGLQKAENKDQSNWESVMKSHW